MVQFKYETEWWTCEECGAQAATWALVFVPSPPGQDASPRRAARFAGSKGELRPEALLVGGDGEWLVERGPRFCPGCGRKVGRE